MSLFQIIWCAFNFDFQFCGCWMYCKVCDVTWWQSIIETTTQSASGVGGENWLQLSTTPESVWEDYDTLKRQSSEIFLYKMRWLFSFLQLTEYFLFLSPIFPRIVSMTDELLIWNKSAGWIQQIFFLLDLSSPSIPPAVSANLYRFCERYIFSTIQIVVA